MHYEIRQDVNDFTMVNDVYTAQKIQFKHTGNKVSAYECLEQLHHLLDRNDSIYMNPEMKQYLLNHKVITQQDSRGYVLLAQTLDAPVFIKGLIKTIETNLEILNQKTIITTKGEETTCH